MGQVTHLCPRPIRPQKYPYTSQQNQWNVWLKFTEPAVAVQLWYMCWHKCMSHVLCLGTAWMESEIHGFLLECKSSYWQRVSIQITISILLRPLEGCVSSTAVCGLISDFPVHLSLPVSALAQMPQWNFPRGQRGIKRFAKMAWSHEMKETKICGKNGNGIGAPRK